MTQDIAQNAYDPQAIADFLRHNPDFFVTHADVFSALNVPHPHQASAISLGERQILTLRARLKDQEYRLMQLLHNASGNERIQMSLIQWCTRMLAEADAQQLLVRIPQSLAEIFELPAVALRVWDLPGLSGIKGNNDISDEIRAYAQTLEKPYCGPFADQAAAQWLETPPASLALLPIFIPGGSRATGLLVLGSDDADRFSPQMGTDFLELIATLAGAALGRLDATAAESAMPDSAMPDSTLPDGALPDSVA